MTSPLRAIEASDGAHFTDIFDTSLPATYGDLEAEYWSLRRGCALIDAGFRSLLQAVGPDRVSFLQGMLSNDVKGLREGRGVGAAHLTVQGRVISDLRLYALPEVLWLDVPVHRKEVLRASLNHYIVADDVELLDVDDYRPLVGLEGPKAVEIASKLFGGPLGELPPLAITEVSTPDGAPARLVAATHAGEAGFLVFGNAGGAIELWHRARELGAVPVGMEALNVGRIESGVPWYGIDMDDSLIAPEVGLAEAISFQKGCYLGQEVVERATARGHLQKKLVQLMCSGRALPELGTRLLQNGDDIGWITSAAWSPAYKAIVALGYVRRTAWEPGTVLEAVMKDPATAVVGIPARQV
ncbi:MAG TPA: glycine cleavage T C-terminal barrel domain-containing protein [Terriglobales bacterium]|nr:glycine cleavage T C-terminal barrel domain-containing protein [Terriglobales bacterium]